MNRLKDKVVIITGASGGIGSQTARLFSAEGAKLVLTDINAERLQEVVSLITPSNPEVISIIHDVSSEEDWIKVMKETIDAFDKVDILVNNAGMAGSDPISNTTTEKWDLVQSVNSRGVFLGIKYAAELMKRQGGGSIVNISSVYGLIGTGASAAYHASKASLVGLTKTAAIEFAKDLIRINSIHPGVIETPMTEKKLQVKEIRHSLEQSTPWPEFGKPEDIAYGALYLASDEAKFVTGSQLVIDGGYTSL